jgi:hypothetical protein
MEMSHVDTIYGRVLLVKYKMALNAINLRAAGLLDVIFRGVLQIFWHKLT